MHRIVTPGIVIYNAVHQYSQLTTLCPHLFEGNRPQTAWLEWRRRRAFCTWIVRWIPVRVNIRQAVLSWPQNHLQSKKHKLQRSGATRSDTHHH